MILAMLMVFDLLFIRRLGIGMIYEVFKRNKYGRKIVFTTNVRLLAFAKAYKYDLSIWWKNPNQKGWIEFRDHITYVPFGYGQEFTIPYHKYNDLAVHQQDLVRRKEFKLKKPKPKRDWFREMKGYEKNTYYDYEVLV